ncbi:hypothetical protein [Dapis sp. BLCC M172]|uniref:hypothetical protein n=1 Tax=Dapis sp. BLCC M172 TaxID=2975281 RepID=UPI003CF0611D
MPIIPEKYGRGGRCLWPNQPQNHCLSNTSGMGECQKAPTDINCFTEIWKRWSLPVAKPTQKPLPLQYIWYGRMPESPYGY